MNSTLVVEDLPDIRAWLVDTVRLAFPHTEVVAVGRCRDGVGEAATRRFQLALIDLELPDGNGVSVIQALRNHQPQAVSVVTHPEGAKVTLTPATGDALTGTAPYSAELLAGSVTLTIELDGYNTFTREYFIDAPLTLEYYLDPEGQVLHGLGLITTLGYKLGSAPPVFALEGSIAIAGALVQWLRDNLGLIATASEVEPLARTAPDNGGVVVVPAFSGLYAPHWRADARGVVAGLTQFANKGHIARAARAV